MSTAAASLTSRERLRRCFWHEELDRPGMYCRTGFPDNDPSYDPLRRLLAERSDLKRTFAAARLLAPEPVEVVKRPHSSEWEEITTTLHTPGGDLVWIAMRSLCHQPGMTQKHYLADADDVAKYLSQPMPAVGDDVSLFFKLDREVAERGIVDVSLGLNPAGFVAELFGTETLAMMTVMERDLVHDLCRRRMRIMLAMVDRLVSLGVGPYFSMLGEEYVAPPLHSPADFDEFNVRYDQPIIERVHAAGGKMHVHSHGRLATVLDGFLAMGADVLHPIEAPPMGDLTARQAKDRLRGRVCIEGNIQIADMYERTPDEIAQQTRQLIADAFDDRRGLIVCPSASPYIYGGGDQCYQQFLAILDVVQGRR